MHSNPLGQDITTLLENANGEADRILELHTAGEMSHETREEALDL